MDNNNPYAPPKASLTDAPRVVASEYPFRDLGSLTTTVSVLLGLGILGGVVKLISNVMLGSPAARMPLTAERADAVIALAGAIWALLLLITIVVFGRWIYLAHRNLPALGAENLRTRPGWAVGTFFVPIANLWKPFQAMNDLVRASRDPRYWHLDDTPLLVGCWWALWLLVGAVGGNRVSVILQAVLVEGLRSAAVIQLVGSALNVVLYILALLIVRRVWRDQARVVGLA